MPDPKAALVEARRALVVLVATCRETLQALEAADSPFDVVLVGDLGRMIDRSESDIRALDAKITQAGRTPTG